MSRVGVVGLPGSNPTGVVAAFDRVGVSSKVIRNVREARDFDSLVVPGVGSFGPAVTFVRESGFANLLVERVRQGGPVLGICLGFHLFCLGSEEGPNHRGLGIVDARVKRLAAQPGRRVPHIGWSRLHAPTTEKLPGLADGALVYFAHSYEVVFSYPDSAVWTANHGGSDLVAAFGRGSFTGVQFHPEKSNEGGLQLLKGFAS